MYIYRAPDERGIEETVPSLCFGYSSYGTASHSLHRFNISEKNKHTHKREREMNSHARETCASSQKKTNKSYYIYNKTFYLTS